MQASKKPPARSQETS